MVLTLPPLPGAGKGVVQQPQPRLIGPLKPRQPAPTARPQPQPDTPAPPKLERGHLAQPDTPAPPKLERGHLAQAATALLCGGVFGYVVVYNTGGLAEPATLDAYADLLSNNAVSQYYEPQPVVAEQLVADARSSTQQQVFFDVAVDGAPLGRVTVRLYDDVAVGAQRFRELSEGLDGASYRRSKFDEITPDYVRNAGVKQLTYRADAETRLAGGADTFALQQEMDAGRHSHDAPGVVSLVVREAKEREVTEKLVAEKGKFITVQEAKGEAPNGTQWLVTLRSAPALDATCLPVGVVVQGQGVVEAVAALPAVKDNSGSPYFKAGKALGDKRADVAERGFNRPFAKVTVSEAGLLAGAPPSAVA